MRVGTNKWMRADYRILIEIIERVEPSDELFDTPRLAVPSPGETPLHSLPASRVASPIEECMLAVVAAVLQIGPAMR